MYICIHCIHDETSPVIKTTAFGFVFIHRVWLERPQPPSLAETKAQNAQIRELRFHFWNSTPPAEEEKKIKG